MSDVTIDEKTPAGSSPSKITFDGTGGELFVIYLLNIFLTIITLGIFRFWAKTRIRTYVWSHLGYEGDSFEYNGTGMELFLGFVIVIIPFGILSAGIFYGVFSLIEQGELILAYTMGALFYLALLFLFPVAIYRAYRYRLTRTLWRGIRFGLTGSSLTYALKFSGYLLLQIVTLGLAVPYTSIRLYEYLIGNIWMGSGRFSFSANWKPLMRPFLVLWVIMAMTAVLYGLAFIITGPYGQPDPLYMGLALVAFIAVFVASYWYSAAVIRLVVSNIGMDSATFTANVTGGSLFKLYFVNMLLLIFTLGIAYPWILVRIMRYIVRVLEVHGKPDFEKISQSTEDMPKFGEGMAEAFDIGGI